MEDMTKELIKLEEKRGLIYTEFDKEFDKLSIRFVKTNNSLLKKRQLDLLEIFAERGYVVCITDLM